MTLQRRRRLVVSPSPASRGLSLHEGGRGMRRPMGRWNLRLRGSTVTTGLNVAWFPKCRVSISSGMGWAWRGERRREIRRWEEKRHIKSYERHLGAKENRENGILCPVSKMRIKIKCQVQYSTFNCTIYLGSGIYFYIGFCWIYKNKPSVFSVLNMIVKKLSTMYNKWKTERLPV